MFKISAKIHEQVPYKSEVNGAVDISCHMVLQKWPIFFSFIPQLDASELDSEVVHIVKAQLNKLFKYHKVNK